MKATLKYAVRTAFRVARKIHKLAVALDAYEPDPEVTREDIVNNVALGAALAVFTVTLAAAAGLWGLWGLMTLPAALYNATLTVRAVDWAADKLEPKVEEYDPYYEYEEVEVIDLDA